MPNLSIIYGNSVAKCLEGNLIDSDKVRRLMDANFADAIKMLYEYGYAGGIIGDGKADIDKLISGEIDKLLQFVVENSPNKYLSSVLTAKFHYNNAKVYYKSKFSNIDMDNTLFRVSDDEMAGIIGSDYSALGENLAAVLTALDARFTDSPPNAKIIDVEITKAMFAELAASAKKSRSKKLIKYVTSDIDLTNLLTAFRAKLLKLTPEVTADMLIAGGRLEHQLLLSILELDYERIAKEFCYTDYNSLVSEYCESSSKSLVSFETAYDNYLIMVADIDKNNMLAFDPFINYFVCQMMEFKVVKMILVCLNNKVDSSLIKQRLRCIYE